MAGEPTAVTGASGGDMRASILAELASGPKDDAPVETTSDDADVETASQDEAVEDVEASSDEESTDAAESDEVEATDDDADDESEQTDPDPKVAKGLDQVRRAEKHARAKLDADRQAFEAERKQHETALAEVEQFKSLAKRAKYDPAAVLRALGLTEDDFELVGHALYAESKAGQADPNRKLSAQARLREREKEEKQSVTEKRIAELEAKLEADKAERIAQAEAEQYMAGLNESISKTPLAKHLWKADAESVTIGLQHAYERLAKAGKPTKPAAVVAEYEKRERARLQALGVDLTKFAAPAKVAAKPGAAPVVAADKKPANTNANGTTKKVPTRDEIVAELARLKESEKLTS